MIIRTLLILSVMTMLNQTITAQTKVNYKEIKMTKRSEPINVSADRLWEIIGPGFANVGEWSTAIDHAVGSGEAQFEGATCSDRACDLNAKGFSKIKEVLTLYNEEKQELAYDVVEGNPGFVIKGGNHWRVVDLGNGQSALDMTITMHVTKFMGSLMGGMMKKNINALIPSIFHDLTVYAETGEISEEKKARIAKLAAKNLST